MPTPSLYSLAINVYNLHHGVDPLRVIQRHVSMRRFRRRVRWIALYRDVYAATSRFATQLNTTWRFFTRAYFQLPLTHGTSLASLQNEFIRNLMVATRQRLTMQRFARGLRRDVQRARYLADYRRVAKLFEWVLRENSQWTWRDVSRDHVQFMSEDYGPVIQFPNYAIRDGVIATRIRLTMQRFVKGLSRLANSRRVQRRLA